MREYFGSYGTDLFSLFLFVLNVLGVWLVKRDTCPFFKWKFFAKNITLYEGYICNGNVKVLRKKGKTLKKNLALINARPKKILHYQKPIDLFNENLAKCCA